MRDLIEALQIFAKYSQSKYPTHCEHYILYVCCKRELCDFLPEDVKKLEELGFDWDDDANCFISFRFGSC